MESHTLGNIIRILWVLKRRGWSLAFAESCTGGQLAANITSIPGSSEVVVGSAVCYQLRAKHALLGLTEVTEEDVVSSDTAVKMAVAARRIFGADVGVGTTGYLDGRRIFHWAIALPSSKEHIYVGSNSFDEEATREVNRLAACEHVFDALLSELCHDQD